MRNLKNKKFIYITIFIVAITVVYLGIEKIIDDYNSNDVISAIDKEEYAVDESNQSDDKEDFDNDNAGNTDNETMPENDDSDEILLDSNGSVIDDERIDENSDDEVIDNKIYVYVTGQVNRAGVVVLNEGSRIVDAINAAGGTTNNADVSKINLVFVLEDGMKVNIPSFEELKNNPNFEYVTLGSGDGYDDGTMGNIIDHSSGSGSLSSDRYDKISVVNINTATQTELETLPGIGPSLALKIINFRKENGKFNSIEEIKNVSGIGDSKFESIKKYIKVWIVIILLFLFFWYCFLLFFI